MAGRRLDGVLTTLLLVVGMTTAAVASAPIAAAAGVNFAAFYSTQDNGAIALIGNSQMSCPASTSCTTARNAAPASNNGINNNSFGMTFLDQDSDPATSNSTSADLALPTGSTVLSALLVWGARRSNSGQSTVSTTRAAQIAFKAPGSTGYTSLTGSVDSPDLSDTTNPYQGWIDVTARVKAAGNGTYWIGDIAGTTGADRYAGWSLIVAYRNSAAPLRDLEIFKGFNAVSGSNVTIPISGFLTPASGQVSAAVGIVAYEGDRGTTGDAMTFNGTTLSDATRPSNNFFNSSISDLGTAITARNPNYANNLGFDIGRVNATNILSNSQTSTSVVLSTTGDVYYPGVITTQIDLFTPAFSPTTKSVVNLSGNNPAKVGDTLQYQISMTNTGADPADNSVITDALPPNVSYVPGSLLLVANPGSTANLALTDAQDADQGEYLSAGRTVRVRVGAGATGTAGGTIGVNQTVTVRFRVTLDRASAGTTVSNTSNLSYRAHTIGKDFTFVSNQVDTPVGEVADLSVTKSSDPTTQNAGSTVVYRLIASNAGPNDADAVVITDTLPAGVSFVSAAPPAGTSCSASGQTVTCTTASLTNGASISVPITAAIAPGTASGSNLTDVASVSSDTGDDNPGNNTASATTAVTTSADVGLTKTVAPGTVAAGSTLTYTLRATNNGPSTAGGVTITDPLPAGLTYLSSTPAGICTQASGTVTCALGGLTPNQTSAVTITARVASNVAAGTIINTATVKSTTPDPVSTNNTAAVPVTVTTSADLSVTKTASPTSVVAGNSTTYTIAVTNQGPSDAAGVTVNDPAVTGLAITSAATTQGSCTVTDGAVSCPIGAVASGSTVTVTVTGRVDSTRTAGTLTNTASVSSATPDPVPDNNSGSASVTVRTSADLALSKTADPATIVPGAPVTYTLTATNHGPSQATGVTITDPLPTGLTFSSATAGCTAAGQLITCLVGVLANGASATVTITAATSPDIVTAVTNTAAVSATTPDPNPANNTATAESTARPRADLAISKTATDPVIAGSGITYTIAVRNNGPSTAQGVAVADTAPAGVSFTAVTQPGSGLSCSVATGGGSISCSGGTMSNGATATITVTGTVGAGVLGTLVNTATVFSSTADPTPGNNSGSATSQVGTQADVAVTLSGPSAPVPAGTVVTYQVKAVNNGPSTARDVVITGQIPPGLIPVLGSSGGACVYNAGTGTVTCALGDLPPDAVVGPILLQATIDPAFPPGTIDATAIIGSSTPDINPANNTSAAPVTVIADAALSVDKTVTPDPLVAGSPATYTITVGNAGPSDARTVVITDELDPALRVVSANPTLGSCAVTGQHVECTAGTLPANTSITVSIVTAVSPSFHGADISNTAAVSSPTDPDGPHQKSITTAVVETAHLTLTKTAQPSPVVAGGPISYTLTITNNGPSDAADVVLDDPLPAGVVVLPDGITSTGDRCPQQTNATSVSCSFGAVEAGGTRTVTVRASTPADLAPGTTLTNTATVSSPTPDSDPAGRTASVATPVTTSADLQITKSAVTDPIEAGAQQTYLLQITNNGPSVSRGVVVTDPLPSGFTQVSVVPSAGCSTSGAAVSCSLGDLGASQTVTLQITGTIDPSIGGTTLTNTASVASAPTSGSATPDPVSSNNSSTVSQPIATRSDLSLTKTITPDGAPIVAGSTVSYTITATNHGPSDTTGMVITDAVPAATALVTAAASDGGSCQLADPLTCRWPAVAAGQTRTVTLTVAVPATAAPGEVIVNTATVDSDNVNATPDDSTATASGPVTASADVSVVKTLLSGTPVAGGTATWQLVVHNAGPSQAADVVLDDAAPTGVTFLSATPTPSCTVAAATLHCPLGVISAGASATVTVTGRLAADYPGTSVTNTASVDSGTPDPDPTNNTSSNQTDTQTSADLTLTKTATSSPFVAGQGASWTLRLTNGGPSVAANTVVTDVVPAGVGAVAATVVGGSVCTTAPGSGADAGATVVTCSLGSVAAGAPVQIQVTGTVLASTIAPTLSNTGTVRSSTPDPNPADNSATATTPVTASADLRVTKTGPATAHAGEQIGWQVEVTNAGPSDAQGATVTDTLPAGITGVTGTAPAGPCSVDASTMTCAVGRIPAGGTVTVTVAATIGTDTTGTLTNTARVTSTTADPDVDNNSSTSHTAVTRSADVAVVKTFDQSAAVPGGVVSWTLTASNAGPSTATSVVVTDQVPASVDGITGRYGPTQIPCSVADHLVSCEIGSLRPGFVTTVAISGTLRADYAGATLDNTTTISSPDDGDTPAENSSTTSTPVTPSADVSVGKELIGGVLTAGATGTYQLTVRNAGPSDAHNVVVTDQLPTDFRGAVVSPSDDCTITGTAVSCTFPSVPAGAQPVVTIDGTFDQNVGAVITNTARVTADTPDPVPSNNTSTATGTLNAFADLQLTKSGPAAVIAGQSISWQIIVHNGGPSDAHDVTVTDVVPAAVTGATALISGGGSCAPGNCAIGTIPAGQTVTVTVTGTVSPSFLGTSITNAASVSAATPDPDGANNQATATTAVSTAAHLSVSKSVSPAPLVPGRTATYTITVANTGPSDARASVASDPLPDGITVRSTGPSASQGSCQMIGRTVVCDLGVLPAARTATITIPVSVDPGFTPTSVTNDATVSSPTPDPDPSSRTGSTTTQVTALADLTLVKTGPAAVVSGQGMSWTMTLTNAGPSVAQNVVISDQIPAAVTGVAVSATQGSCALVGRQMTCTVGILAPGDTARITLFVTGTVDPAFTGTAIDNTATVTSDTPEPGDDPTAGRSSTAHTGVSQQADLSVVKTPSTTPFTAGSAAGWTITVHNAGPSTATSVTLTDTLPTGLVGPVFRDSGGSVLECPAGVCALGTLAAGGDVAVTVSGTVDPDLTADTISNTVAVGSAVTDPVQGNNTSISAVPVTTSARLVVDKTGPVGAVAGGSISWTIDVSNDGPSTARDVRLADPLPEGITDVTVTTPADVTCSEHPAGGSTLSCALPDLAVGAPVVRLVVTATVDPAYTAQSLSNTATATTSTPQTGDGSSQSITPVSALADLSIAKTGPADPVVAGTRIGWTVVVTNAGPSYARAVTVDDPAPSGVSGMTGSWSGGTCDQPCALGDLAPHDSVTISYSATVQSGFQGASLTNVSSVSSATADPVSENNTAQVTTEIAHSADLSITKTVSPDPLIPGDGIGYRLAVHNAGPSDATGVAVSDPLPDSLVDPVATPSAGSCQISAGVLSCDLGTIVADGDATVTITATLSDEVEPGTVNNAASVTASTPDPDLENNTSQASADTANADLSVTKTASATAVFPGDRLVWTVESANAGPGPARHTVVTDHIPDGTALVSVTSTQGSCTSAGQDITCQLGTVPAGEKATVVVTATVDADRLAPLTNAATAFSPDDADPSDNVGQVTTEVKAVADLSLAKTVTSGPAVAGKPITWQLTATNAGPAAAPAVVITDPVPAGVGSLTVSPGCVVEATTVRCRIESLASGASVTATVTGVVSPGFRGALRNTATVSSDLPDLDASNNSASSTTTVGLDSDLSISKTADRTAVQVSGVVTYTIAVAQHGASTSDPVSVTETLPAGATVLDARASQGSYSTSSGVWSVGQVAPGVTQTLTLSVRLGEPGAAVNRVSLAGSGSADSGSAAATVTVTLPTTVAPPPTTAPGPLPNTGFAGIRLGLLGMLLILLGGLLLLYRGRRRGAH